MTAATRFSQTGGPDVLGLQQIELASPGQGEVRVRHRAIGVNFIDIYHRTGLYKLPLPSGLGLEAAGDVEAVGAGVSRFKIGDRVVYASGPLGAYSEASNVVADRAVRIPDGVSFEIAAAILLKGLTAHYLLCRTHVVKPGEAILFHAAAGGVGVIAVQWAKSLGATVIGTVGSEEKAALAKKNGYKWVIDYTKQDILTEVKKITKNKGVPVVYDGVGKDTWAASLDCLQPRGLMVSFGNASGAVAPVPIGVLNTKGSLYVTRPSLAAYTATRADLEASARSLFKMVKSGKVKISIDQHYPLAEAAQAHIDLESRKTTGQTVLVP